MCTVFASAVRRYLPHATLIVDRFRLVKLAGDALAEVRRRVTTVLRGRRGRDSDPDPSSHVSPPQPAPGGPASRRSAHPDHQRRQRRPQPGRPARRLQRPRLLQPRKPAATNTLRNHPPSPRIPQPRPTSTRL
ncbi:transposase [Frankia sp. ArI3]|uniref:transposase n=1 Tax=Frankia sp. ArI3 TaxID=1858 RepID=UPI00351CE6B3